MFFNLLYIYIYNLIITTDYFQFEDIPLFHLGKQLFDVGAKIELVI